MCSTPEQRIAEIRQAIDDLAAEAVVAYSIADRSRPSITGTSSVTGPSSAARTSSTDQVVIRLAELWALLAELDPEVARRLPTYQA